MLWMLALLPAKSDSTEGFHDAPDRSEQPQEGSAAHGRGQKRHFVFKADHRLSDGPIHGVANRAHLLRGDHPIVGNPGAPGFLGIERAGEMDG